MTKMERLNDEHVQLRIAILAELMERRTATVAELAKAVGLASHVPVFRALAELERYGNVEQVPNFAGHVWRVLPRDEVNDER